MTTNISRIDQSVVNRGVYAYVLCTRAPTYPAVLSGFFSGYTFFFFWPIRGAGSSLLAGMNRLEIERRTRYGTCFNATEE